MKFVGSDGKIIVSNLIIADRFFSRVKGLIGKKSLSKEEGLLITKCNSIHTFFMKFPIDVLFLKKENKSSFRVVKKIEKMEPFRLSPLVLKADTVLELKAGKLSEISVEENDVFFVKEER